MIPSVYINLEDGVEAIASRIKRQRSEQVVLVCPKGSLLFSDPIYLKLLKTEISAAGKEVSILTMDENGQAYAQAAGFELRQVPGAAKSSKLSDVKLPGKPVVERPEVSAIEKPNILETTAQELKSFTKLFAKKEPEQSSVISTPPQVSTVRTETGPDFLVEEIPDAAVKDTIFPRELEEKILSEQQVQKKSRSVKRTVVWFAFFALLLAAAVIFLVLPKATVLIYPRAEQVTRDIDITLSTTAKEADADQLVLPAIKVSETLQAADDFQSQGKKQVGNPATGTVKIYNFTKAPINLKAGTTTFTVNGQNYKMSGDLVQVKPTSYSNVATKEIDQSSLGESVELVAVTAGEAGNLPAGTRMEISNQVFGSKPQLLYAKTDTAISGGVSRYLSFISDPDILAAQNSLKQNILSQLRAKLAAEGKILPDNDFTVQVTSFVTDKPVNSDVPTFSASLLATVDGLAFNKNDLSDLIYKRVNQSIAAGAALQDDPNLESTYKIKSFDFNAGSAIVTAHLESSSVYQVDVNNVAEGLVGKTPAQVNDILETKPEIDHIDVILVPGWQKTFPWLKQKIEVIIKDQNTIIIEE